MTGDRGQMDRLYWDGEDKITVSTGTKDKWIAYTGAERTNGLFILGQRTNGLGLG